MPGFYPCNPSIAQGANGYAIIVTYRDLWRTDGVHFEFADGSGVIRTRNMFGLLDEDLNPTTWEQLGEPDAPVAFDRVLGVEDPRLYWQDGWRYAGSLSQHHLSGEPRLAIGVVRDSALDIRDAPAGTWVKNQMPTGAEPEFIDIMASSSLHGGAVVKYGDGYLGIAHAVRWPGRVYSHRFARFDGNGRLEATSGFFRFGSEPIEFAAGIVLHGDDVVVSYGVMDREAWLARFPLAEVVECLRWEATV